MKKDRDKLSTTLTAILMKNNANNKLREKIEDELQNKFRAGIVNDIYNLRRQTKFLSEEELYLFVNALYENFELLKKGTDVTRDMIDPSKWFTDNEIINAKQIKFEDKKEQEIWFELHNVDMPEEGVWVSSFETYKNLADNWNKGAIYYNQETQREGIIKTILGEQITVPKLIDKNVDEIYKSMLNHEFFANMITLNIQDTGLEKEFIEYYPESRVLRVKKTNDSVVSILDGFHRLSSILRVMSEYPDFEGYMSIRCFNLDIQKAQSLILQESRGTSLGEQTIKTFDVKNKYMQIAKKINNYESESTNSLYHKLTYVFDEVKNNTKYCLFSNISNGLEDNFEDIIESASPRDIDKLTRYLVAFFNEWIGIYQNYFNDLEKTKKDMVIADINIFSAALLIAKRLYAVNGWQDKLEEVLGDVIWDRTNPAWKNMLTNSLNWNKPTKSKIYSYFNDLINEKVGVI